MDSTRFDRIAAALTGETGRRDTLRLLGASLLGVGGLALLSVDDIEARKKRKNKKKKRKKKNKKNADKCKGRCGGQCPRCDVGTTCSVRDECSTAFCDGGVCSQPADAAQCGTDTNGDNCFRRENDKGIAYCSRQNGNFIPNGSCSQCAPDEQCTIIVDSGVECLKLCGSPL